MRWVVVCVFFLIFVLVLCPCLFAFLCLIRLILHDLHFCHLYHYPYRLFMSANTFTSIWSISQYYLIDVLLGGQWFATLFSLKKNENFAVFCCIVLVFINEDGKTIPYFIIFSACGFRSISFLKPFFLCFYEIDLRKLLE